MKDLKTSDPNYFKNYYQRNKDKMKENSRKNYLKKKGINKPNYNMTISHKSVLVSFD